MRSLTKPEIEKLKLLTEHSVSYTLIEPTLTGLGKSIMDATGPVRTYLHERKIHNYSLQKQGPDDKKLVKSFLVETDLVIPSVCSLYRPVTKKGDPRIWFKGLPDYAKPNDILAIVEYDGVLYVVNVTRLNLSEILLKANNPLKEIVGEIELDSNAIAIELLSKLRRLTAGKPIRAEVDADTGVGRTLESLLNLKINSNKGPDYKGIELKSYRDKRANRKSLFAQVPNWNLSKFKSSKEILESVGYPRGERYRLNCTVSTKKRNSQGLILRLDKVLNYLFENSDKPGNGDIVVWSLSTLHKRLLEKHNETFWIAADSIFIDNAEHFIYTKVEHTRKPIASQFDVLLDQGIITLDHVMTREISGKVTEKGPFFKLKKNALGLLFPPSTIHNLTS